MKANFEVDRSIDNAIRSGREIGIQVAAYLDGELVVDTWGGFADVTTNRLVDGETLFNVFSVSKAVAATALHIQAERGRIEYEAPVARYWPEYAIHGKGETIVRDILTHRAGIPQMPEGVTPERMCDWGWMTEQIAMLKPVAKPGSRALYQSMTFGWLVGELVRRTDPQKRNFGQYVQEEIAQPLGLSDLWLGLPPAAEPRVARLVNASPEIPPAYMPPLYAASMPPQVDLIPSVFERPDVRRACVPGVGGIFNARSEARFWAMLAQGGELGGVRLLSEQRVRALTIPRGNSEEPDPVMFNIPLPISNGGFWLGSNNVPVCSVRSPRAICHPGAGGSIGWADPDSKLAVAICHNRMFNPPSCQEDAILPIADAIRSALGI